MKGDRLRGMGLIIITPLKTIFCQTGRDPGGILVGFDDDHFEIGVEKREFP